MIAFSRGIAILLITQWIPIQVLMEFFCFSVIISNNGIMEISIRDKLSRCEAAGHLVD